MALIAVTSIWGADDVLPEIGDDGQQTSKRQTAISPDRPIGWIPRGTDRVKSTNEPSTPEEFVNPVVESNSGTTPVVEPEDSGQEIVGPEPSSTPSPLTFSTPDSAISLEGYDEPSLIFHPNEQSMTWILGDGDRIGFFSAESGPTYEFGDPESLTMTSGHGIHFLSGPSRTDLPPRLFDFFLGARWTKELTSNFGFDANFSAGIYTDFEDSIREGWRFPGRALLYLDTSSTTRMLAGIEYLDRDNIQLLPAGGLIITPEPDLRLELYFPRPRLRYRLNRTEKYERWLYLGGEYKGSSWAIERVTGIKDVFTYNEYRVTLGWETRYKQSDDDDEDSDDGSFIEFGYIFGRDLEYRSRIGNFSPDDTLMVRWGSRF